VTPARNGARPLDTAHSEAAFQVRHLVTRVRGRFTDFEGTITADSSDPSRSSVQVAIKAASIDTSQPDRDAHLRSADFTINRKDYGLMWNAALETGGFLVGDEVKITLAVQAVAQ
jgi:polyisoprenoid-binding protein YceI